jgi:hypothetical protein
MSRKPADVNPWHGDEEDGGAVITSGGRAQHPQMVGDQPC